MSDRVNDPNIKLVVDNTPEELNPLNFKIRDPAKKGKRPPDPPTHDWLKDFELGTIFLGREFNSEATELTRFKLVWKGEFSALLEVSLLKGSEHKFYVTSARFSQRTEMVELLGVDTT